MLLAMIVGSYFVSWEFVENANVCSLVPKPGEVKLLINSFSVDMLCTTETWLNSDVADADVS